MSKKLLDFNASISDVKQVNPLFSTCKVRVMYTGKNQNLSSISKDAVEKALPTLKNIPIVGEYSVEAKDFKGHGGKLDLDSYDFVHTTKPYGVVPESATYEWEEINGREYLTVNGCYLWTGRYDEAFSVVESGKSQSMEIEVTNGRWNEEEEVYQIDNFIFSALCILGDDVRPAFEESRITAYTLDKDSFNQEYQVMLKELKYSLSQKEMEVDTMMKELLEKYSLKIEDLTAKGIDFNSISEDELEAKIIEVFEIQTEDEKVEETVVEEEIKEEVEEVVEAKGDNPEQVVEEVKNETEVVKEETQEIIQEDKVEFEQISTELETAKQTIVTLTEEVETLRAYKLEVEKADHESKAQELFSKFQLTEVDVEGLDIHKFSLEDIEEKCYAILGRKMAKKNFSKDEKKNDVVKLKVENQAEDKKSSPYGGLFEKYKG